MLRGVQYKSKDGQEHKAYAPLTIVCDGCFSNLHRSLCKPQMLELQSVPLEYLGSLQPGLAASEYLASLQPGLAASEYLASLQLGLAAYYKDNRSQLPGLVSAILPTHDTKGDVKDCTIFEESMVWLQWLMFDGDPGPVLEELMSVGQHGVCCAVLGKNETAYLCRTCQRDPTRVICVNCFQNGYHKDHDYFIIPTSCGFCDCGDAIALKREGFCSKHRGAEQIQPLSKELAKSMGPVLDLLFIYWKNSLTVVENSSDRLATYDMRMLLYLEIPVAYHCVRILENAYGLATAILQMLLDFCNCSERLLSFISERMVASVGLLDILVRADQFVKDDDVARKLQELLLKLLSNPILKNKFAMPFFEYYFTKVNEAIYKCNDAVFTKYQHFAALIFTDPTLTLYLVKEHRLLFLLLECLDKIFKSCADEDGRLQFNNWVTLYATTIRVLGDVRYVMSHAVVAKYVIHDGGKIIKMWIELVAVVQGMDPQNIKAGKKHQNRHMPFVFGQCIANIHSLLVAGVFCESSGEEKDFENSLTVHKNYYHDQNIPKPVKKRKLPEEISVNAAVSGLANIDSVDPSCEPTVSSLTNECLRAIESWLRTDDTVGNITRTENATELEALSVLSLPDWPHISYDVSPQGGISVNIPLHRLLSTILQRAARKCNVEFSSSKTVSISSLAPVSSASLFGNILGGCHPHGFSAFVMEHPLRIRVFCAQVHAGMWKKNRKAAVSSKGYNSSRWSEKGLEFDLFLLQCCATLAPTDLYVTRLLERFGLSTYLKFDIAQSNLYEPVLMQELLTLLIQIIQERKFCGLSEIDSLKREIVHRLAIRDSTRIELVCSLPWDLSRIDGLQEVFDRVAIQSEMNQGLYALRLEYWKEVDLYYPLWNSKNLQIAKERYLHFCQTSALTSQLPKWTDIYEPFNAIANLATCKAVLEIVRAVLFYGVNADKSRAPDTVVMTAMHLLSLALDICIYQRESNNISGYKGNDYILPPMLAFANEEIFVGLACGVPGSESLLSLLQAFARMQHNKKESLADEAANISSLIGIVLSKFEYIDSECQLAPKVVID